MAVIQSQILKDIFKKMRRLPDYKAAQNIEVDDYQIQNDPASKTFYVLLQNGEQLKLCYADGVDARWEPILSMVLKDVEAEISVEGVNLGVVIGGVTYPISKI